MDLNIFLLFKFHILILYYEKNSIGIFHQLMHIFLIKMYILKFIICTVQLKYIIFYYHHKIINPLFNNIENFSYVIILYIPNTHNKYEIVQSIIITIIAVGTHFYILLYYF